MAKKTDNRPLALLLDEFPLAVVESWANIGFKLFLRRKGPRNGDPLNTDPGLARQLDRVREANRRLKTASESDVLRVRDAAYRLASVISPGKGKKS